MKIILNFCLVLTFFVLIQIGFKPTVVWASHCNPGDGHTACQNSCPANCWPEWGAACYCPTCGGSGIYNCNGTCNCPPPPTATPAYSYGYSQGSYPPPATATPIPTNTPTPTPIPTPPIGQCLQLTEEYFPVNGLVSYYKMDETTGSFVEDNTTYSSNDGTSSSAANFPSSGGQKLGTSARTFNGSNIRIDLGNPTGFQTQQLTISAWIKRGSLGSRQEILGYGTGGYTLYIDSDNVIKFGKVGKTVETCQTLNNTTGWFHIAVTYSNQTGLLKCYLNNSSMQKVLNVDPPASNLLTFTTNVSIGAQSGSSNYFNGTIDEVGIWNRDLTSPEVAAIYNQWFGVQLALTPGSSDVAGVSTEYFPNPSPSSEHFLEKLWKELFR